MCCLHTHIGECEAEDVKRRHEHRGRGKGKEGKGKEEAKEAEDRRREGLGTPEKKSERPALADAWTGGRFPSSTGVVGKTGHHSEFLTVKHFPTRVPFD